VEAEVPEDLELLADFRAEVGGKAGEKSKPAASPTGPGQARPKAEAPGVLRLILACSAGLCPGLWGLPAFFAGRARHGFFPGRLPIRQIRGEFFPIERL